MKPADIDYVRSKVENEGFDYCFTGYSEFKDIECAEFHALRKAYCDAADALKKYLRVEEYAND